MSQLYTQFKENIAPTLMGEFSYKNIHEVPAIKKITINVGYGRHSKDKSFIDNVEKTLTKITGQKPVHNEAKKAISNFKIRKGMDIGMSVTLRGENMFEFLYRLINLAIPRIRDFRGLSTNGFDRQGNYTFGIKENVAFPEIVAESLDKIHGLQIVITTSATNKKEGMALLEKIGMPFKK